MTTEPADTLPPASQPADSLRTLNAELLGALLMTAVQIHSISSPDLHKCNHGSFAAGDCRWTYQQNQAVLAALKKDNKDLKALLAQLPASNTNGRVSTERCKYCAPTNLLHPPQPCLLHRLLWRQSCEASIYRLMLSGSSMTGLCKTGSAAQVSLPSSRTASRSVLTTSCCCCCR